MKLCVLEDQWRLSSPSSFMDIRRKTFIPVSRNYVPALLGTHFLTTQTERDAAIAGYDKYLDPLRDLSTKKDLDKLNLDSAIARLKDIDNKQRSLAASVARSQFKGSLNPLGVNFGTQNSPLKTTHGGDAMDLSSADLRPHGPLSQEEKGNAVET
ncbi:hypothetical protein OnM2_029040 [Erysiphe neolycopersici]|uniref:Uncharacterized protein n=1 Tax=Erysiphe neolycopersici TaxID=212602 RepID=A0A420HZV5_9PEZI|nr:hypothetical protein OnM2_029040 [Erysiphe neolycopersici]